jgi:hypothetical protein
MTAKSVDQFCIPVLVPRGKICLLLFHGVLQQIMNAIDKDLLKIRDLPVIVMPQRRIYNGVIIFGMVDPEHRF